MAAATPIGTAISAVTTMTKMLPVSACQMPACDARRDEKLGDEVPRQPARAVGDDVPDQRGQRGEREQEHEQRQHLERRASAKPSPGQGPAGRVGSRERDAPSGLAHAYSSR